MIIGFNVFMAIVFIVIFTDAIYATVKAEKRVNKAFVTSQNVLDALEEYDKVLEAGASRVRKVMAIWFVCDIAVLVMGVIGW